MEQFNKLSAEETDLLKEAIPIITVLIAGADGNIDPKEEAWAKKVANIRTYNNPDELNEYYKWVGESYEVDVHKHMKFSTEGTEARTKELSDKLAGLNDIFPKLDPEFAKELYESLKTFANHVARASGGILGYGSISNAEKALIDLPMLNEVIIPDDEDVKE